LLVMQSILLFIEDENTVKQIEENCKISLTPVFKNIYRLITTSIDTLFCLDGIGEAIKILHNDLILDINEFLRWKVAQIVFEVGIEFLKYQKVFDLNTLEPIGAEFFCGLPVKPFLLPKYLNQYDLMTVDFLCVKKILEKTREFRESLKVFINTFPSSWEIPAFSAAIFELLEKEKNTQNIVFEVLELRTNEKMWATWECLKNKYGVMLALDDFGSESSSISRLMKNVDIVKVDKQILWNPKLLSLSLSFLATIKHHFKVVAEGIENEEHLKIAKEFAQYGQGFYLHKPEIFD